MYYTYRRTETLLLIVLDKLVSCSCCTALVACHFCPVSLLLCVCVHALHPMNNEFYRKLFSLNNKRYSLKQICHIDNYNINCTTLYQLLFILSSLSARFIVSILSKRATYVLFLISFFSYFY